MAKTNAGIIDLVDSQKAYSEESSRIRRELFQAEADLAEHQATLNEITGSRVAKPKSTNSVTGQKISTDELTKYRAVCGRLTFLQNKLNDYLLQQGFTEENKLVKEARDQMTEVAKTKNNLEEQYPELAELDFSAPTPVAGSASASNIGQLASLPTRIKTLKEQLLQIQAEAAKLDEAEAKIADLQRKKTVQEGNLKYFDITLQQARIDEALGPGRVSNIKAIQMPSPPFKDFKKFYKNIATLFFGGLFAGLAWAFLIEFYLDRSIKRPIEIQTKLKIPFFLSIPDLNQNGRKGLGAAARKQLEYKNGGASPATDGKLEV